MLANISLFKGLSEDTLRPLLERAVRKVAPKNTIVITEGDQSDSLYVIVEGRVKVFLQDEEGKEIILNFHGPGEYFGELALVDDQPRSASVMTLEKSSFQVISKTDFRQYLVDHPDVALVLIKGLCRRLRMLTDSVKSLALMDVYGRVAKLLLSLAQPREGKMIIENGITHQEIANRVGASREMVGRILRDLVTGGYIHIEGKTITVNEKLPPAW
ncbi:MAG: Crp/Fnr family transcriptional regulator [Pseudomonadota bacterium]